MLKFFFYILLAGIAILLLELMWPVWLMAIAVLIPWAFTLERDSSIAKAARSILEPTLVGLLVLAILQLVLNLIAPDIQDDAVARSEQIILFVSAALAVAKLAWWQFALLLIALIVIAAFAPSWKPVTHTLALKRHLGTAGTIVGVLASFTFFTTVGVVEPQRLRTVRHLRAIYERATAHHQASVARYLAARHVEIIATTLDTSTLASVGSMIVAIDRIPALSLDNRRQLLARVVTSHFAPAKAVPAAAIDTELASLPDRPLNAIETRLTANARATLIADETEKAVRALLGDLLKLPPERVNNLAWSFFETMGASQEDLIIGSAKRFTGQVMGVSLRGYTDPAIEAAAKELSREVEARVATASRRRDWPKVLDAELDQMHAAAVRRATTQSIAAEQAGARARAAFDAGNDAAGEADLLRAERSAAQATDAARFADEAGRALSGRSSFARLATAEGAMEAAGAVAAARRAAQAAKAARALRALRATKAVCGLLPFC